MDRRTGVLHWRKEGIHLEFGRITSTGMSRVEPVLVRWSDDAKDEPTARARSLRANRTAITCGI